MLSTDDFATLVRLGPLVSIDLVVHDPAGCVLVGRRTNEPARGTWFVPGGSIQKGETLDVAFRRIAKAELGIDAERADATFRGVYEHHYPTNFTGDPSFGTHYIVLAYELRLPSRPAPLPADQHGDYRWLTAAEARDMPDLHPNTLAYFG